jgi:hypothetical protein
MVRIFRAGDIVEIKVDCGGVLPGIYRVEESKIDSGVLCIGENVKKGSHCSCAHTWILKNNEADVLMRDVMVYGRFKEESIIKQKNKKTTMTQINIMMKKLLDSDTQTLVRAGFLDNELNLTDEGKEAIFVSLFDTQKAALVVAAQAKIDAGVLKW